MVEGRNKNKVQEKMTGKKERNKKRNKRSKNPVEYIYIYIYIYIYEKNKCINQNIYNGSKSIKICIYIYIYIYIYAQSDGAVEYTDCFSAEGLDPHSQTSVLEMTLNNLMMGFQKCWSFGEYRVLLFLSSLPGLLS